MITPQQFRNPQVKPKWQLPVGVMESIVAYNCRKYGFPRPVLAMPLWESAGNRTMDYSGHGNHGTLTNGPNWVAEGIDFDGSNDYVRCEQDPSLNNIGTGDLTISMWIKYSTNADYGIIGQRGTSDGWYLYNAVFPESYGQFSIYAPVAGGYIGGGGAGIYDDGIWHHVSIKRASSGNAVVIDGVNQSLVKDEITSSISLSSTSDFIIGSRRASDRFFPGTIDNIHIFNADLSLSQIKFLSNNPYFMYEIPEELYGYVAAAAGVTIPVFLHLYNQMRQ